MNNLICKICGKECEHLGSHIWHAHKVKAKDYKYKYNLDFKYPLISGTVKKKKQDAWHADADKYLENIQGEASEKYKFKKGHSNTRTYFSEQAKKMALTNLQVMNNLEKRRGACPICKTIHNHIESHLYNKHGLLLINRDKFYD